VSIAEPIRRKLADSDYSRLVSLKEVRMILALLLLTTTMTNLAITPDITEVLDHILAYSMYKESNFSSK
jgi:hypothetical protein